ncbi:DsbA family protein [Streptomyces sp. GMY02]|uniref:DsbA family protein n=1 Tax=Streptomyces sp. GMY02 TaxID=1333528 RepID=UPI00349F1F8C
MSRRRRLRIEVWSDIVCPWCYLGKRRLDKALDRFAHAEDVEVVWCSFQLDPTPATACGSLCTRPWPGRREARRRSCTP